MTWIFFRLIFSTCGGCGSRVVDAAPVCVNQPCPGWWHQRHSTVAIPDTPGRTVLVAVVPWEVTPRNWWLSKWMEEEKWSMRPRWMQEILYWTPKKLMANMPQSFERNKFVNGFLSKLHLWKHKKLAILDFKTSREDHGKSSSQQSNHEGNFYKFDYFLKNLTTEFLCPLR